MLSRCRPIRSVWRLLSRRPLHEHDEVIGGRPGHRLDAPETLIEVPLDGCRSYV
jgi:hypothetical protein